jgi:hypothetical protein
VAAAIVAGVACLSVIVGTGGITWGFVEARHERDEARLAARKAEAVNGILLGTLGTLNPNVADKGIEAPFEEILDRAAARVETDLREFPELESVGWRPPTCMGRPASPMSRSLSRSRRALSHACAQRCPAVPCAHRLFLTRSGTGALLSCSPRIVCAMQRFRSIDAEPQGCRRIEHDGDGGNWSACPGVAGVSTDEMTTPARA